MNQVYNRFYDPNGVPPVDDPTLSHRLSLMFMILAIGSLVDINAPAYNTEAEKYHQLARAALFQNGLFDEPTINAVQALVRSSFLYSAGALNNRNFCSILCRFICFLPIGMGEGRALGGLLWAWL